jgi:hypothetical protein
MSFWDVPLICMTPLISYTTLSIQYTSRSGVRIASPVLQILSSCHEASLCSLSYGSGVLFSACFDLFGRFYSCPEDVRSANIATSWQWRYPGAIPNPGLKPSERAQRTPGHCFGRYVEWTDTNLIQRPKFPIGYIKVKATNTFRYVAILGRVKGPAFQWY